MTKLNPSEPKVEYKRSFKDDLDWTLLEQLHRVVLQISTFCFRTKQICLTADVAVIGLLAKFTESTLDHSMFVAGLVIPLCFWFLDSVGYFYQVKLRGVMENIQNRLHKRNTKQLVKVDYNSVIERRRVRCSLQRRVVKSLFNNSMWMYFLLIIADLVLWLAFFKGVIG